MSMLYPSRLQNQRATGREYASSSVVVIVIDIAIFLLQSKLMERAAKFVNRNLKPSESRLHVSPSTTGADQSSFMFSSLPNDVALNCLACVPRCYYPILSCVSKNFRTLVRSPELAHMRTLMGKNYPIFYVCFTEATCIGRKFHWFTFNPHEKKTSVLNSITVLPRQMLSCSIVSIGTKIYFIGGSTNNSYRGIRVFNPWSGELCEGPSMKVARVLPGVVVVDGKIYVMGGCGKDEIKVEVFDPKTQTWEVGPLNPHGQELMQNGATVAQSVAVEGKVYGMSYDEGSHIIYDTKDGSCESFEMANEDAWRGKVVCVIDKVIYVYYTTLGLMWYDSNDKMWRVVEGLKLDNPIGMPVGLMEFNGKLALLWEDRRQIISQKSKKKIWCMIIKLDRCGVAIHGTIEWSHLVGSVPFYYDIWRCVEVSE